MCSFTLGILCELLTSAMNWISCKSREGTAINLLSFPYFVMTNGRLERDCIEDPIREQLLM